MPLGAGEWYAVVYFCLLLFAAFPFCCSHAALRLAPLIQYLSFFSMPLLGPVRGLLRGWLRSALLRIGWLWCSS